MISTDSLLWSASILSFVVISILFHLEQKEHKRTKEKYKRMEEQFYFITQNAKDIVYHMQIYPKLQFEYLSPAIDSILGYAPKEFYEDPQFVFSLVYSEDVQKLEDLVSGRYDYEKTLVIRWHHREGHVVWIEENVEPFYNENGELIALQGIARDVTQQKKLELKLTLLSQYDSLTGLYNRTYFEQEIARLEKTTQPYGLIIIDVDGLKQVNDSKGHPMGDRLIQATANVISKSCRKSEVIARIGGDEFAILIPNARKDILEAIRQRIQGELAAYNSQSDLFLSFSIGCSFGDQNIRDLYKKADADMYRQKNKDSKNYRIKPIHVEG